MSTIKTIHITPRMNTISNINNMQNNQNKHTRQNKQNQHNRLHTHKKHNHQYNHNKQNTLIMCVLYIHCLFNMFNLSIVIVPAYCVYSV